MPSKILIIDDEADNIEILIQMLNVSSHTVQDLCLELDGRDLDSRAADEKLTELLKDSLGTPIVNYASTVEDAIAYIREAQADGDMYDAIIIDFNLDEIHGEQVINLLLGRLGPMLSYPGEETPELSQIDSFEELYKLYCGVDYTAREFLENTFESPAEVDKFAKTIGQKLPYFLIFSGCYTISSPDPEILRRVDFVQKGPGCESEVLEALFSRRLVDKVPDRREFQKYIDPDQGFMATTDDEDF